MLLGLLLGVLAGTGAAAGDVPPAAQAGGGSCIDCHRAVEAVAYIEHNFEDWEKSVHARAGVSCDACHGGDPAKADKAGAHAGMKPSTDKSSPLYFTRVPASCGKCHEAEGAAFRKSAHHRELQRTGRGPNCVTCHGAMANFVLGPRDLERTCTLCHRRPTQAYATLLSLTSVSAALKRLESSLAEAKAAKVDAAPQQAAYDEALRDYRKALEAWHTFDMKTVLQTSRELTKRARVALNELELKRQQQEKP